MKRTFQRLWRDDGGAVIAIEFLLIATILALGIIPGLTSLRNAIVFEFEETATAIDPDACDDPVMLIPPPPATIIDSPPCG